MDQSDWKVPADPAAAPDYAHLRALLRELLVLTVLLGGPALVAARLFGPDAMAVLRGGCLPSAALILLPFGCGLLLLLAGWISAPVGVLQHRAAALRVYAVCLSLVRLLLPLLWIGLFWAVDQLGPRQCLTFSR